MKEVFVFLWDFVSKYYMYDTEVYSVVKFAILILNRYFASDIEKSPIANVINRDKITATAAIKVAASLVGEEEDFNFDYFYPESVDLETKMSIEMYLLLNFCYGFTVYTESVEEEFSRIKKDILEGPSASIDYREMYIEDLYVNYYVTEICNLYRSSIGRDMDSPMRKGFVDFFCNKRWKLRDNISYTEEMLESF